MNVLEIFSNPPVWIVWFFGSLSAALGMVGLVRWGYAMRILGAWSLPLGMSTARFGLLGANKGPLVAALGALVWPPIINAAQPGTFAWQLYFSLMGLAVAACLNVSIPPVVLFLSSSSAEAAALMRQVETTIYPGRAVALLNDRFNAQSSLGLNWDDNLRTREGRHWRKIVKHLIETVPLIVVDLRRATGPVGEELLMVQEARAVDKTLFLSDPTEMSTINVGNEARIVPPSILAKIVKHELRYCGKRGDD